MINNPSSIRELAQEPTNSWERTQKPATEGICPREILQETHTFPQETRTSPQDASMLCVDKQKRLNQRMAYRHRDRNNHRRSLVVWESAVKPHWILRCRLKCALGGMRRRSRSSSHNMFLLLDVAQTMGETLSGNSNWQCCWFDRCSCRPNDFSCWEGLMCVCRWACEFPCGEYSFRRPHFEEAISVACASAN